MARIFGYAWTADYEETPSLERQRKSVEWRGRRVEGAWQGCRSEHDGGPWAERRGFQGLLRELEPGDHLVIYDLRRLDRKPTRAIEAAQALVDRQVHLHVLRAKGLRSETVELDLDPATGRAFVKLLRGILDSLDQAHRDSIRDALQYRKRLGLVYNAHPPFGKKRVVRDGVKMDVWDFRQCSLIVEIWTRHQSGESILSIARDFHRRRVRTGSGSLWVRRYGRDGRLNANRVYRALKFYEGMLDRGERFYV